MANEKLYEDMEPREKFEALWLKAGLHKRPGADALLYDLEKRGFFDLPASIKHHSNRFGGLATHTVNVADAAMELCETNHAFKDCDKNAVLVAALLHDICKVNKYHETAFHKYGYEDRGPAGSWRRERDYGTAVYQADRERNHCGSLAHGRVLRQGKLGHTRNSL